MAGHAGFVAGSITREIMRAGPKAWIVAAIIVLFFVLLGRFDRSTKGKSERQRAEQQEQQEVAEQKKREAELAAFNNMTPTQHIEQAKSALKPDATVHVIDDGLRNLEAIPPSSPEFSTARALKRKLTLGRTRLIRAQERQAQETMKQNILSDARNTARHNYIDNMREIFRDSGVDASISDIDGQLVIVSDLFKLKPNRDEILRTQFGPTVRRALCTMGFRTLALKSGVLFGHGDEYSLGCPETKEEKEARVSQERTARQTFIGDLQRKFGSDPRTSDMQVTEGANEVVLTAPQIDLYPQVVRAMWEAEFSDRDKRNLCGIGFRGLRVRSDANSTGTFMSFGCGGR